MSWIEKKAKLHNRIIRKFYPTYIYEKVENIPLDLIKKDNIKLILLDMDNTIIGYYQDTYSNELKKWADTMHTNNVKLYILSNSPHGDLVKTIAEELNMGFIYNASKPLLKGFNKIFKSVNIDKSNILMVGDQLFTDVFGGNRFGVKTVLVNPINDKEIFITKIKRPLENIILKHYLRKRGEL